MLVIDKKSQLQDSGIKTVLFTILTWLMTYTPLPILKFVLLILDVTTFWVRFIIDKLKNSTERTLIKKLNNSTSWMEFSKTAYELDNFFHNDVWKDNLISSKYDYRLIQERLHDLRTARSSNDISTLLSLLRAGMLRNFGGISNKNLYNRTYIGTKSLIEQYNKEITNCLQWLDEESVIDNQVKLDFYHDAKTTLGTTALCLHGGSLFGLCHIGVVKSMIDGDLLPNVIVGSSVGSAVGALVCCFERDELIIILSNLKKTMKIEGFDLNKSQNINEYDDEKANVYLKWMDNLKKGLTTEVKQFIEFTLKKIGNITFKEAYKKSGKILNILVYPTSNKIPTLLNYLSTPYITIESAIYCSLGTGILEIKQDDLLTNINLMIKYKGEITRYSEIECEFHPPYQVNGDLVELKNSPYNRITELFNVNHFIISISRPYLASFSTANWRMVYNNKTMIKKIINIISLEFKHRIRILNRLGLLTSLMRWLLVDEKSILLDTNYIPILPVGNRWLIWDLFSLFVQNDSVLNYWICCGERSVWVMHSLLETRFRTEFLLEEYYEKYRKIN
jgi:TAG lipase/lysophosphatidylethanolamine acyltransferase